MGPCVVTMCRSSAGSERPLFCCWIITYSAEHPNTAEHEPAPMAMPTRAKSPGPFPMNSL
jgi:hypothetical protein